MSPPQNGAEAVLSPTYQFSASVFMRDIEITAAAIQAPYSASATRDVIAAYAASFHQGAVLWRATSRPGDALNYRFYERQPTDTVGTAIKAGLLNPDNMAVGLVSGWSGLYRNSTELCDFDAEVGLAKTWIYLGGMRPLDEILGVPAVPEAVRRRYSQLQDLGLAVVRHVAVDYLKDTMNIYFAVPGPITETQCQQLVSLAHGEQPSPSVFADMRRYMAPNRFTFSVTMNIDDGAIGRVGFYALKLPAGKFPAIGSRLTEFFATAPSRDDEEMNAVAWSFGPDGKNYLKAERSYSGQLVQLMREWSSPMTDVSAHSGRAAVRHAAGERSTGPAIRRQRGPAETDATSGVSGVSASLAQTSTAAIGLREEILTRKRRHIDVCLHEAVDFVGVTTGFERYRLTYNAMTQTRLRDIHLGCDVLGVTLRAPILIGAMTGGAELSRRINRNLAAAAQHLGLGMMLGSQRIMLDDTRGDDAATSFAVRDIAPDVLLIGNIGIGQVNAEHLPYIAKALDRVGANALAVHTNPLQEAVQPGGDNDFSNSTERLRELATNLDYPVLLKEVGHGLGTAAALALRDLPLAAIDVAGAGGTSWARVEQLVRYGEVRHPALADWGIPTAQALLEVRATLPDVPVIASGGIRTGMDAAKAIALGAHAVAIARPLLPVGIESTAAATAWLEHFIDEMRICLHGCGVPDLTALRRDSIQPIEVNPS